MEMTLSNGFISLSLWLILSHVGEVEAQDAKQRCAELDFCEWVLQRNQIAQKVSLLIFGISHLEQLFTSIFLTRPA